MGAARFGDTYGRQIQNLRISVTDRCNMRCVYCMPKYPVWLPHQEILTYEELIRLANIFVRHGTWKIRVTGGEPTVRKDLVKFIQRLTAVDGLRDVSLTTNGVLLDRMAEPLFDAGLRRINISLDSLRPDRMKSITRTDDFDRVMKGLEAARRIGFEPVKLNMVAVRGINEDEVVEFARFGRENGYEIRFIEFMPLDAGNAWDRQKVYSKREILRDIGREFAWEPAVQDPNAPAELYRYKDGRGRFGVIGSVTEPFCTRCDRVRLTADGKLRTCLFSTWETDLKAPLRAGETDEQIAERIRGAIGLKEPGHFINSEAFQKPDRTMHRIGG